MPCVPQYRKRRRKISNEIVCFAENNYFMTAALNEGGSPEFLK